MPVSYSSVKDYLKNSPQVGKLCGKARMAGFGTRKTNVEDISNGEMSRYLEIAGIKDVSELDQIIEDQLDSIEKFFSAFFAIQRTKSMWRLCDQIGACCLALIYNFPEQFKEKDLVSLGYERDAAQNLINCRDKILKKTY